MVAISQAWCHCSYTTSAKLIKSLELHYTMNQFLIMTDTPELLKAGFQMIATIVGIAEKKNCSAIVAIDDFHMIARIAEKVNEDRGDLSLTTSFVPFVKLNMRL